MWNGRRFASVCIISVIYYTCLSWFEVDWHERVAYDGVPSRDHHVRRETISAAAEKILTFVPLDFAPDSDEPRPFNRSDIGSTPPLFILSAWYDTRPLLFGADPRIHTIMLADFDAYTAGEAWWTKPRALRCIIMSLSRSGTSMSRLHSAEAEIHFIYDRQKFRPAFVTCQVPFEIHRSLFSHPQVYESELFITFIPSAKSVYSGIFIERWVRLSLLPNFPLPPLTTHQTVGYVSVKDFLSRASSSKTPAISVCTSPLRSDLFDSTLKTWLAFQQLMGASSVFVYEMDVPVNSGTYQIIRTDPSIERIQWVLPSNSPKWKQGIDQVSLRVESNWGWWSDNYDAWETRLTSISLPGKQDKALISHVANLDVHYFGQTAAINDCLFRQIGRYRWFASIDFDEYLIPHKVDSWFELINGVTAQFESPIAGIGFRNTFHRLRCVQDDEPLNLTSIGIKSSCMYGHNLSHNPFPSVFYQTRRADQIHAKGIRSKFLVDPILTQELFVHYPRSSVLDNVYRTELDDEIERWLISNNYESRLTRALKHYTNVSQRPYVDLEDGLLHHFRAIPERKPTYGRCDGIVDDVLTRRFARSILHYLNNTSCQ